MPTSSPNAILAEHRFHELFVRYGREAVVKLLLDRDADIESKCNSGRTPLSWIIYYGHEAIVKLHLARSADESQINTNGRIWLSDRPWLRTVRGAAQAGFH